MSRVSVIKSGSWSLMDTSAQLAGFWRRLMAAVYDLLLASAVCVLASVFAFVVVRFGLPLLWQGIASDDFGLWLSVQWWFRLWLIFSMAAFYVYFWTRGGQTLGMAAWRLRVVDRQGQPLTVKIACLRLCCCFLGLGNLCCLFKPKLGLQDLLCNTQVVVLPKTKRP